MIYVLDTDIPTILAHADAPESSCVRRKIAQLPPGTEVVTTVINYEEQMRGWMGALAKVKYPTSEVAVYDRLLRHLTMFRRMAVLPYGDSAESIARQFLKQRVRVGTMDLKIASIAVASKAVLVTRNLLDFRKFQGLQSEDWAVE